MKREFLLILTHMSLDMFHKYILKTNLKICPILHFMGLNKEFSNFTILVRFNISLIPNLQLDIFQKEISPDTLIAMNQFKL